MFIEINDTNQETIPLSNGLSNNNIRYSGLVTDLVTTHFRGTLFTQCVESGVF